MYSIRVKETNHTMTATIYKGMLSVAETGDDIQQILAMIDQDQQNEIQEIMDDFNYVGSPYHY
jgi:hypothetical protein